MATTYAPGLSCESCRDVCTSNTANVVQHPVAALKGSHVTPGCPSTLVENRGWQYVYTVCNIVLNYTVSLVYNFAVSNEVCVSMVKLHLCERNLVEV